MVGSYEGFPHPNLGLMVLSILYGGRRQSGCGGRKPSGLLYIYVCIIIICTMYVHYMMGGKNCGSSIFESEILVFILKTERNLHFIFGVFDF